MNSFFTWQALMTCAGATLATSLITQLIKGVKPFAGIPTRIVSYAIALIILLAATLFSGGGWNELAIAFVKSAVVALAANGAFDAANSAGEK